MTARMFTNGSYNGLTSSTLQQADCLKTIFFHFDEKHLDHTDDNRKRFRRNMEAAAGTGKKVWLRWNIDRPGADFSEVLALAKDYSASIEYSITVPIPNMKPIPIERAREYAPLLVRFVQEARAMGLALEPGRAFPLCAFEEEQLRVLREQGNIRGTCQAINDITVNTDRSLQLCSVTHALRTPPATGEEDLRRKVALLEEEEQRLRSTPALPLCRDCPFFERGECQGGCHAYRFYGCDESGWTAMA